jgi:hypothetical protein
MLQDTCQGTLNAQLSKTQYETIAIDSVRRRDKIGRVHPGEQQSTKNSRTFAYQVTKIIILLPSVR